VLTEYRLLKPARCAHCGAPRPVGGRVFVEWATLQVFCGWHCASAGYRAPEGDRA